MVRLASVLGVAWALSLVACVSGTDDPGSGTVVFDSSTVVDTGTTEVAIDTGVADTTDAAEVLSCASSETICGGKCVDTSKDAANCGACGKACASTEACTAGKCALACGVLTKCGGADAGADAAAEYCANLKTDNANCGTCGKACPTGQLCADGVCSISCGSLTKCVGSDAGGDAGGDYCANLKTDNANCGACGKVCGTGESCVDGACTLLCGTLTKCPGGGTPYCANTKTDNANCGACGTKCGSSETCIDGVCTLVCSSPLEKCGTPAKCVDTRFDPDNCGGCGKGCTFANATAACSSSTCTLGTCTGGYGNCDGIATNGCETNTQVSLAHCGGCGKPCSYANASATCLAGICSMDTCNTGFDNCDGVASNGCEVNLSTDPNNCGGCTNKCTLANAVAGCTKGSCTVASCTDPTTYGNCDGIASNGCEASLKTDNNNCGACGNKCTGTQTCKAGVCTSTVTGTYTRTITYGVASSCTVCASTAYTCASTTGLSGSFVDPVPSGGKAVTVQLSVYAVGCGAGTVTMRLNGTVVGTFAAGSNCSCGTCDAPYVTTLTNLSGLPGYVYGGTNTVTITPTITNSPCVQRTEVAITAG